MESLPASHHSLALPTLVKRLEGGGKILDLGPATGANVSFFSALPSSLYIADLPHTLFPAATSSDAFRPGGFAAVVERELPCEDRFDVILAWDLLNYLDLEDIGTLSRRLAVICAPTASLFGLICTRKSMSDRPAVFNILGPDRLGYEVRTSVCRAAPMYKEPDLARSMPEFEVESTYLLRNGMQEYLFARRVDAA